jgi:hypothetical protein
MDFSNSCLELNRLLRKMMESGIYRLQDAPRKKEHRRNSVQKGWKSCRGGTGKSIAAGNASTRSCRETIGWCPEVALEAMLEASEDKLTQQKNGTSYS